MPGSRWSSEATEEERDADEYGSTASPENGAEPICSDSNYGWFHKMHHEIESEREKSGGTVYKERVERTEQKQKNERENQ